MINAHTSAIKRRHWFITRFFNFIEDYTVAVRERKPRASSRNRVIFSASSKIRGNRNSLKECRFRVSLRTQIVRRKLLLFSKFYFVNCFFFFFFYLQTNVILPRCLSNN